MVLESLQSQTLINHLKHRNINEPVQETAVIYVLRLFEGNINPEDPTGLNFFILLDKEKYRDTDKLDISV